jgi:hypothetical protein
MSDGDGDSSVLPRFLTEYKTFKQVVIKSPFLQVPNVCLQVCIVFYIVAYRLGYNLRFMDELQVNADADMTVNKPMSNWATCHSSDFDCYLDLGDRKNTPYCANHTPFGVVVMHGIKHPRRVLRCWQNDVHIKTASRVLVPTMVSFLNQSWSAEAGHWMTDEVKEYYMQSIESFSLRFRHSFTTTTGLKMSSIDMNGRLSTEVGKYRFATGKSFEQHQKKHNVSDAWSSIPELEQCGTDPGQTSGQVTSCSRTLWGNVISVKKLLHYSGISSLDEPREGMDGATFRQSGLHINVHISYSNHDKVWERFFFHGLDVGSLLAPPPFYTLQITKPAMARDFVVESKVSHPTINGRIDMNQRLIEQETGILVTITAEGSILFASFNQLLLSVVSAVALLSLGQIVVERIIVKVYRHFENLAHVSTMFSVHKHEGSKSEKEFKDRVTWLKVNDSDAYHHLVHDDVVTDSSAQRAVRSTVIDNGLQRSLSSRHNSINSTFFDREHE